MEVTISTYKVIKQFPDERAARVYLEKVRWAGHPVCPYCKEQERVQTRYVDGFHRCLACGKDFTVRTETVMERSHVPLDKWLMAMYLLVTARKGVSSLQLSKEIGVTQKTAWFMLQRLREACRKDGGMLRGVVEADECYIGGREANKHESRKLRAGRGTVGKTAVMGLRERNGRVRAAVLLGTDTKTVQDRVRASVEPGSTLCTDEHAAYRGMPEYSHLPVNHSAKEFVNGMAHTNGIESVWAVLKRGYNGVYHNFSAKHLNKYVDEFSFRLNEGNCKIPSMDRVIALFLGAVGKKMTYKTLKN